MKKLLTLVLAGFSTFLPAQQSDTTIYSIVQEAPRFPGCEHLDTTVQAKNQCSQTNLLLFFNQNIIYPVEARQKDITGQVVVSFVVEKDGTISYPVILRDIGGGCGREALRVAKGMNDALRKAGIRWTPGKKDGRSVRTKVTVPIKFQLKDPDDFILLNGRDTIYTFVDDSVAFNAGPQALNRFIKNKLKIPPVYQDSCKAGTMDLTVLVRPDGYVRVIELVDYSNLGPDFMWEAISAATETWGHWKPATRKGRPVPSSYDFTITFLPDTNHCAGVIANFQQAESLAEQGSHLFNKGQKEEGLAKLSQAIELFPNNANFLFMRGQAYMNMEKLAEACADFQKISSIVHIPLVEQLMPVICK